MMMKDSGVAWIGDVPRNWAVLRTKHVFRNHKDVVGARESEYERLALTLNGVIKRSKTDSNGLQPEKFDGYQIVHSNELIFKLIDLANVSTSRVGLSPYEGIVSPAYIVLYPHQPSCLKFAEYFFYSLWQREVFNHIGDEGVRSSLSADTLLNIPYVCPSVSEQQRIANFLDAKCASIDVVIAKTNESIEEYKKLKQSVITEAVTKGVRGKRPMKESGFDWIGKMPSEWHIMPSKFLFKNVDERKRPSDELLTSSQKYGIISQKDYMELEKVRIVLANKGIEEWKHVEPDDFIISLRSFQGGLEMSEVVGCITWHYIVLRACKPIHSRFFKWLFKSSAYINALQRTCNFVRDGQDLRYSNFVQVPLYDVPLDEQREIADYLDSKCAAIDTLISKKQQFIDELTAYKKSLIYEYVTGKKEVPA